MSASIDISLFDSHGVFQPLAPDVAAQLSPIERQLYGDVEASAARCAAAEQELAAATADLKSTVREIHDVEARLVNSPKRSFMDEWRSMRGQNV